MLRLICLLLFANAALAAEAIHFATPEYIAYAEKSGRGYYLDLMRQAFPAPAYQLQISWVPYERSRWMVDHGEADVTASQGQGETKLLLSDAPTDIDVVDAAVLKRRFPTWQGQSSLTGQRVNALIGYGFDSYAPGLGMKYQEKQAMPQMLQMLLAERIDVVLDYESELKPILTKLPQADQIEIKPGVLRKPLYFAFGNHARGKALKQQFDQTLARLKQSGELKRLFQQYPEIRPTAFP